MDYKQKIDELMMKRKIDNLRQLAEKSGVPYTTIRGIYDNPNGLKNTRLENIQKISKCLHCTWEYLGDDNILDPTKHFPPDKEYLETFSTKGNDEYLSIKEVNDVIEVYKKNGITITMEEGAQITKKAFLEIIDTLDEIKRNEENK